MKAEIIAVGSELLTPTRLDTNSLFLSEKLGERGIDVVRKCVVGDDRELLTATIQRAREEHEIVITTGGLGPTLDDLTRESVADATGRELVYDPAIEQGIAERFRRSGRKMSESNRRQAYVLDGAEMLPNANGTAPGQWFEDDGRILMLLPGPPRELKPLFHEQCEPRLAKIPAPYRYYTAHLRVANLPESEVDQRLAPIYSPAENVQTTILASPGEIQLHFRGRGASVDEAEAAAVAVADRAADELGEAVYSREDETLEAAVQRLFREKGWTLATVESCTGGLIAQRLTDVPGSSAVFVGGFVTYSAALKSELVGVPAELIAEHGVVSEAVARAMAEGVRERTGATVGVSTTGEAGPEPADPSVPVGKVFLGVSHPGGTDVHELTLARDRHRIRLWSTRAALDRLRLLAC